MNAITVGQLINNNASDEQFKPYPNLDYKYGPYSSIAEALAKIPVEVRAIGLTVGIRTNSNIKEYWFNEGVEDRNLVVKTSGGGEGGGEAGEDGKTPAFAEARAMALEPETQPTANVVYIGVDQEGNPQYRLQFGIPAGKPGIDGIVPNWKTFVFKQSDTQPNTPTGEDIIPTSQGWKDAPTSTGIWWMSVGEVNGQTNKVMSWSTPIKCTGEDGVAGKYYNFKYAVNTSKDDTPAINRDSTDPGASWSDVVPDITPGQYIWMTIGMFNDGQLEGRWSAPVRINAEDGVSGVGFRMMYTYTTTNESPAFNSTNINPGSAWTTYISAAASQAGKYLWGITAQINADGSLASEWQGPILMSGKPGEPGTPAVNPNWKTYVYKKQNTIPDKPLGDDPNPSDWEDAPDSSDGQWWQCIGTVSGETGKVISWSAVVPVNGKDGQAQNGRFTEFRFAVNSSQINAPSLNKTQRSPSGWTTSIPSKGEGEFIWMTCAVIEPDGVSLYSNWEDPTCISGEKGPIGDTGPAGKPGPTGKDGVDGIPGISIEARYSLGNETKADAVFNTNVAGTRDPSSYGWSKLVPTPTQDKLYIYCIQTRITYTGPDDKVGVLETNWSNPFRLSGLNGLPGADGNPGKKGQVVYPQGIYSVDNSYTTTETAAPYVLDPSDGNFYVMNYIGTWRGKDQVHNTPSSSVAANERYWIKFEAFEAVYAKIGIIANGLIGSAVFNGNYMFSQQGVDANGLKTTAYENFNPDNPGAPLNGKTFVPATLLDLKEGDAWFGHGNMNIDSQGNVAINGYIKERFDYFNGGVDEFSDIMIQSTRQVMIASDTDCTTKFAVGYSSGNIIMPTQFKLDLNVPVNIKFINLSSFMWNLVLDNRKSGLFSVNYWEEYGDMDQVYTFPKVFLHGGRVLDLIFLPTTLKTETIGSIITTYYHGDWHVINTNEFVMKRGTAGDYSDYILESKNLEYK